VDFCISALHGFFKYAKTSGYYSAVELPTTDQQILKKSDRNKMGGYKILSDDDLKLIFDPKNLSLLIKPHEFWMPILGLFTGARINELAQLGIGDVYQSGEIYVIRIAVNGDDTKSVKTDASNRIVPLHKAILEAGFLDYLDDVRKLGKAARRVFPYLAYHDGGYAKVPGDAFGRYMDSLGLDDKNKVFHSLRKTMNNRMKELGVPEETRSQLLGHKYVSTNSTIYSVPHDIQYLKNVIDKLYFEGVDTSKIKYQPGQFLKILKSEMARRQRELNHKAAQQRRGL
jgi:integrase